MGATDEEIAEFVRLQAEAELAAVAASVVEVEPQAVVHQPQASGDAAAGGPSVQPQTPPQPSPPPLVVPQADPWEAWANNRDARLVSWGAEDDGWTRGS